MVGKYEDDPFADTPAPEPAGETETKEAPEAEKREASPDTSEEMHEKLMREGELRHRFSEQDQSYEVKTTFGMNNRGVRYRSSVFHNGKEMEYEVGMLPVERRYALAEDDPAEKPRLYAKEACQVHTDRCDAVKRRLEKLRQGGEDAKKTAGPGKGVKVAFVLMVLVLVGGSVYFLLPKIQSMFSSAGDAVEDSAKPSGSVSGIGARYDEGSTVAYTVRADDDEALKKMAFKVTSSSVNMLWNVKGKSASQSSSFSTQGWHPGAYDYVFRVEDKAGNVSEYGGRFQIAKKLPPPSLPAETGRTDSHSAKPQAVPDNTPPSPKPDWEDIGDIIEKSE